MNRGVAILGALLGACRGELPATEIVVTVNTTFGVPCAIDTIRIEAMGRGEPAAVDIELAPDNLPVVQALIPGGDVHDVTVNVTGLRSGVPLARATAMASFVGNSERELRFVLDRSCVAKPCDAVGIGGFRDRPEPPPRAQCGEHGYSWKPALLAMRDACAMPGAATRTILRDADEAEDKSPLSPGMPFPFWFYGQPVTQVWAGTNGYLGFGDTTPNALIRSVGDSRPLGDPAFPGRGLLAFWDNLRTGTLGVCFTVTGEFPDRMLWITWKEACFASANPCKQAPEQGTLTFGAALEETSNRVYVGYRAMSSTLNSDRAKGQTATIGVTNAAARGCPTPMCSSSGTCQDGTQCGYTEFPARRIVDPLPTLEFDPQ